MALKKIYDRQGEEQDRRTWNELKQKIVCFFKNTLFKGIACKHL